MKIRSLLFTAAAGLLFYQCDPAKKVYSGEEYRGTIDTSYTAYDDEYDEGYDDYYDEYAEGGSDSAYSHYSPQVYRVSATRVNDILHTKLEVRFDWAKAWMYGKATLTVKPYFKPVSQLVLDAKGFEIKEVSMLNGNTKTPLHYTYNTDTIADSFQLVIDLGKEFKKEEQYKIFIDYIAKPNSLPEGGSAAITNDKGLYFINNDGKDKEKPMQIWTQGETEAASCWFPTIDKPNEKSTEEIYITVDDKYKTLSNGLMADSKKNADGTRTDHWVMDLPHSPYLFMMAIGEFTIVKDSYKGKDVNYYVEDKYAPYAKHIFGNTPEMIGFFSNTLGVEFPWQKYAQIVVRDYVSGAMENTTATLHGEFLQQTDRELLDETYEDVVSHELFHSWFGDYVTTESWSNLPLNESFATYGEYLWREHKYGRDDADNLHYNDLQTYLSEADSKQVNLIRFYYEQREDMFDSHSYAKGGCVLHMLRKYLGDEAFFAGLNKYLNDNKFSNAEIENLRLAFESVTGEDLHWFFDEWFLNKGHADIYTSYVYDAGTGNVILSVSQLQDTTQTPVYTIPVDVDVYINGKAERHRIIVDRRMQDFTIAVASKPDLVNFDAEKMILGRVNQSLSADEYAYLYDHGKLFQDRYDAINWIAYDNGTNTASYNMVVKALDDKNWVIRQFALDTIHIDAATSAAVKNKIMEMAVKDPRSYVRAAAISRLNSINGPEVISMLKKAIQDSSYTVVASGLNTLYTKDSVAAVQEARAFKNDRSINLLNTVWDIMSRAGDAKDNDYFIAQFDKYQDWKVYYVMIYYYTFLINQKDSAIINKGVDQFKKLATSQEQTWYTSFAGSYITSLRDYYQQNILTQDHATQDQWQNSIDYMDKIISELPSMDYGGDY